MKLEPLHLVLSIAPEWDGLACGVIGLSRGQRALGHAPEVWCLDTFALPADTLRRRNIGENGVRVFAGSFPSRLGYSRAMARAAVSAPGSAHDVLHQHGLWRAFSRVTQRWRARFRRPTVVAPGGTLTAEALRFSPLPKKLALWAYEAANLRSATCLHAESDLEARSFRAFGLHNPIAVIPSGVPDDWLTAPGDAEAFRRRFALEARQRVLLFLSRLHPIKGLPLLLESLALPGSGLENWCLVVAGRGKSGHAALLRSKAKTLGLEDRVRFVDHLETDDKRNAFAAAELFVLPTSSESFGIVVAEALGAAVPVITTRGAPWEELDSYRCGWHVERTAQALRSALDAASRLPAEELRQMGLRGRRLVAEKYTWSRVACLTVELYDWLLGRRDRPDFVTLD